MIRIAITPEALSGERHEALVIRSLLDAGWDRVHLRHPAALRIDMQRLIEAIPQSCHSRLVLHGHFDLCNDFNLGGLHLNSRCPVPPALYKGPLSRSCHSIDELRHTEGLAYATLSPIFDSISKRGYLSRYTKKDLTVLTDISTPVIALGGVTAGHIAELRHYNFSGFAMLGAIPWDASPETVKQFAEKIMKL